MIVNGATPMDTVELMTVFIDGGYSTELLEKCNSQEFKSIGGYGLGHFLMHSRDYVGGETVTFGIQGTAIDETLYVLECIGLEDPSTEGHIILKTAEYKYVFDKFTVQRNYNVMDRRTQIANTAYILPPDATTKTLQQVMSDFLGISISYTAPTIYPIDVFIQGMSHLEAMDTLCAAYGLCWRANEDGVKVFSFTAATPPTFSWVEDIRDQTITPPIAKFTTIYPVLNCCVHKPRSFEEKEDNSSTEGRTLRVFMPYFPAIFDSTGSNTNSPQLVIVRDNLKTLFQAVNQIEGNYMVSGKYRDLPLHTQPNYFCITFADWGNGPKTVIDGKIYPYLKVPAPEVLDRRAKNWIGYLYQTYKGTVAGFVVVPAIGIDGDPPETNQYVVNLYKWDYGASGAVVRVEWDCVNYRWIPLQQEYKCPPSGPDTTPEEPPTPPEYPDIEG